MRLISWLKGLSQSSEVIEGGTYVPMLTDTGEENGGVLIHTAASRDLILSSIELPSLELPRMHDGGVGSFLWDQVAGGAATLNATVQSGQLLQIVGSPELMQGIKTGAMKILQHTSDGSLMSTVSNAFSGKMAGHIGFAPASCAPIVAPLAAWQILHAVAGVSQLRKINARLDSLQRGIERLSFRLQAKTLGEISAAVATLEDLNYQLKITGTFSQDMVFRLALADRDIQAAFSEQQLLIQRFTQAAGRIQRDAKAKDGAVQLNALLKEEAPDFLLDAKILTAAARASVLSGQAWLRHDLEHNPRNTANRLRSLQSEMEELQTLIDPLSTVNELDAYAKDCIAELNWFSRKVFNRGLAKEVTARTIPKEKNPPKQIEQSVPTVLVWKGQGEQIKSVISNVSLGEA
jgi:prefoldin subunit 5